MKQHSPFVRPVGVVERNDATIKVAIIRRSYAFEPGILKRESKGSRMTKEVSTTLRCQMGDNQTAVISFAQNTRDEVRKVNGDGKIVGALAARPGMKQTNYVMKISAGFKGNNSPHARGIGYGREVSQTLGAQMPGLEPTMMKVSTHPDSDGSVRRASPSGIKCLCPHQPQSHRVYGTDGSFPTINAMLERGGKDDQSILNKQKKGNTQMTAEVRRLTPMECERLMGFPDGYTAVMGAESARYSGCGNSWASNCARVVLKGIHKVNDKTSTVSGDLKFERSH